MKKTYVLFIAFLLSLAVFSQKRALHFDGTNDYVSIPQMEGVLSGANLTFETWIKPTAFPTNAVIVSKGTSSSSAYFEFNIIHQGSSYSMHALVSDYYNAQDLFYDISAAWLNQWHHLAATYDGSLFVLYVDGTAVASTDFTDSEGVPADGGGIQLGGMFSAGNHFAGSIDEVRIWNVARTQVEIQSSMNTEINPNTPGLTAYYRLNDGAINGNNTLLTAIRDWVASPNNGTLMNFALSGATSNFTAGYASLVTLPVKNNAFTATKKEGAVQLSWKGLPGEFSSQYEVERSTDGREFIKIGSVTAVSSSQGIPYSFTDVKPVSTINYYRLKSIDESGVVTYSETLAVRMQASSVVLQAYPNPVGSTLQVQIKAPNGLVIVQVKDLAGRPLLAQKLVSDGNTIYSALDVSGLAKGCYLVLTNNETLLFTKE